MKRFLITLAIASLFAPAAFAQLYKYVDKDGRTVYSDQPPTGIDSTQVNAPAAPASGPKSFVERDKELDKARTKARDDAKKAAETEKTASAQEERCRQATDRHRALVDGGRIWKYDDKGERTIMDDEEIETEREKARRVMDEACKKS
jgi:hypothetical protein